MADRAGRIALAAGLWISASLLPGAAVRAADPAPQADYEAGRTLFEGAADLRGRIRTHLADLPPAVVRCGNCHAVAAGPEIPRSLAPRLTRDLLLKARSRRGGPASFYDGVSFCTLLRAGVDPAHVVISVEMPMYTVSDAECRALWRFTTGGAHATPAD